MLQHKDSNYYVNMKAKDIINQLLESKSIKAGPFAKEIGVHPTQIYDLQSEKIKKISASIASKIVNRYPVSAQGGSKCPLFLFYANRL